MENLSENKREKGSPKKILDNGETFDEWMLKEELLKD
jgi:hypothetical protein